MSVDNSNTDPWITVCDEFSFLNWDAIYIE